MKRTSQKLDAVVEATRMLGSSPEAAAMTSDPGCYVALLRIGGKGLGDWSGSGILRDRDRCDAFRQIAEERIRPGRLRLVRVEQVYAERPRIVATVVLQAGIRAKNPEGRAVELHTGTRGIIAVGQPDPAEDLIDVRTGLAEGQILFMVEPHRPVGLLLAARQHQLSVFWPSRPRTGPRPRSKK